MFERYGEAAARSADVKKGTEALFTAENLNGLPPVFANLSLLGSEKGKPVFRVDGGPLREVVDRIEERANYGDTASGKYLADELAKEPFGWDFDVVQLLTLALVRGGKVEATAKGQTFDVLTTDEAKKALANNTAFRQATFRPKKGIEFEELVRASDAFLATFGKEVRELSAGAIALELRREVGKHEDVLASTLSMLTQHRLPGSALLESALGHMRSIQRGSEDSALAAFNASHKQLADAIKRAAELQRALDDTKLHDLERARRALTRAWPFLRDEADIGDDLREGAAKLEDLLARKTFYKNLPEIDQRAKAIESEYQRRFDEALAARRAAYESALEVLKAVPGWIRQVAGEGPELIPAERERIAAPFVRLAQPDPVPVPIPQMRSERDAVDSRLRAAVAEVRRIIEGGRLATVRVASYAADGIEDEAQLDAALAALREECIRLLVAGKKVILQ